MITLKYQQVINISDIDVFKEFNADALFKKLMESEKYYTIFNKKFLLVFYDKENNIHFCIDKDFVVKQDKDFCIYIKHNLKHVVEITKINKDIINILEETKQQFINMELKQLILNL